MRFLNEINRTKIKRNPFHPFSCFDTSSLAGLAYGQTVLARACRVAGIGFSDKDAHSALYDAIKTAELFCEIVNLWQDLEYTRVRESEEKIGDCLGRWDRWTSVVTVVEI